MIFLNEYEIDEAAKWFEDHPTLGPATKTLSNLRDCANRNSDGWCYWPKPSRASAKLQQLVAEAVRCLRLTHPHGVEVKAAEVKAAYRPIKAFLTRTGLSCEIVEVR